MTEKELKQGLKSGDKNAYNFLYSNYYEWLCNYVFKLCHNYALSEDLVQEVLYKIWVSRDTITINTSLKNYLFKSCHNQFLQNIRKQKQKMDLLESLRYDAIYEMHDEELNDNNTRVSQLNSLIEKLPNKCKQVFIKSKFEKKKYKEIAEEMNISIKTVENHISNALTFIRKNFKSF